MYVSIELIGHPNFISLLMIFNGIKIYLELIGHHNFISLLMILMELKYI